MGQTHLILRRTSKIAQQIVTKFHMNILPLDDPYCSLNSYYANPASEEKLYVQELTQINHSNKSDNSHYCQHAGY